ncbi:hypothetical protein SAMN06265349_101388 [Flavobacterium resistens]|uniref:Uncharacterized protein n=1 Tax=Flavobacterium resistens TaxID=443612 RepID=A0A521AT42_9FLAO|nr:hypothetical protein [Flavobacterium resistens]MRX68594.1 hypothetical protein [Flavobacterium resistens]SMO38038.1 hypothetical protein SAMN06265349_101388 [Flavobacterium resistens]
MDIENSSNGYCNLIFIGKQGSGKTLLINKIFKKKDTLWVNNGVDILVSDNYHNVKTNIKEINSISDKELSYLKTHLEVRTIFILISSQFENESLDYEKSTINSINTEFPSSIILVYVNGEIDENLQSVFLKLHKNIRDVFFISDLNTDELLNFSDILNNIIINFCTNRLRSVKKEISNSIKFKDKYLDIGNSYLTSLYEVPELFSCYHLETLIISNEWGEFINNRWRKGRSENIRRNYNIDSSHINFYTNSKYSNINSNNCIGFIPEEIKNLTNLRNLVMGGDWHTDKKKWLRGRIINN